MGLKENINNLHSKLEDIWGEVKVSENFNNELGNYIQLSITESNKNLIVNIQKTELEKDSFNWTYFSNPEDSESIIERFSKVEGFVTDIKDIFEKNRFDSNYLEKLN